MRSRSLLLLAPALALLHACSEPETVSRINNETVSPADSGFYEADEFADIRVLRYQIPGWDQLSLQQKQLCYYLNMAGLTSCGTRITVTT